MIETPATVECYAGYRYPERPLAFLWDGERVTVEEVEHCWRTPTGLTFRVCTVDGRRFTLVYDDIGDRWDVQPMSRGQGRAT